VDAGSGRSKVAIHLPVYASGLCMWNSDNADELTKRSVTNTNKLDVYHTPVAIDEDLSEANTNYSTELILNNIYLGKPVDVPAKVGGEDAIDKAKLEIRNKLKERRIELKKKVVRHFINGQNFVADDRVDMVFDTLSKEQKMAYLWLEFIVLAHLMTDDDVKDSLSCLAEEDDRESLHNAYNMIKFNLE
jgi:hypothetical protein